MFGKKGQSALEYLMTYGWALVVIVIVIAALVFLINPSQVGASGCTGFSKLPIRTHDLTATLDEFTVIFTNQTGQNLTAATIDATGDLGTGETNDMPATIAANEEVTVVFIPGADNTLTNGGTYTVGFTLEYTDADDFAKTATGSCKGTAPAA